MIGSFQKPGGKKIGLIESKSTLFTKDCYATPSQVSWLSSSLTSLVINKPVLGALINNGACDNPALYLDSVSMNI